MTDLMSALEIMTGPWVDINSVEVPETKTPEDYLIEKDVLRILSKEAQFLCQTIVSLPNEFYRLDRDQINWGKLCAYCKEQKHWGRGKVVKHLNEIKKKLSKAP